MTKLLFCFSLFGVWSLAQTTTTTTPSTSTSTANAIVYTGGSGGGANNPQGEFRQYPNAYNVVGTPALPAFPQQNDFSRQVLFLATWRGRSIDVGESFYHLLDRKTLKEIKVGPMEMGTYPENKDPVVPVAYNPDRIAYPGDVVINRVTYTCHPDEPISECYGKPLAFAKKHFGIRRVAFVYQGLVETLTNGSASQAGISIGGMLPNGTAAGSLGLAKSHGQTVTRVQGYLLMEVICLNNMDSTVPIALQQEPPRQEFPKASSISQPESQQGVSTVVHVQMDPIVVKVEVPALSTVSSVVTPRSQAPNACSYPFEALFEFDSVTFSNPSKVMHDITELAAFLKQHDCGSFEVQGHASREGSHAYNAELASRRAKAVLSLLERNGVRADRPASISYDEPSSEIQQKNRRVNIVFVSQPSDRVH